MSQSCARWRGDIGAYLVDVLDSTEGERVTRHLAACAGCQAEYDELVPVRNWLRLLALAPGAPEPGPLTSRQRPRP